MGQPDEEQLRAKLAELRARHRELDTEIIAIEALATPNQIAVRRLKKEKLQLKDLISTLEDKLFPDIIA
ncbi:MAG: DUF465 domain-containing protein [Pseudomonadota bacterium]